MIESVSEEKTDRLPPHDQKAEQSVLGAILELPDTAAERVKLAQERFGGDQVFYDLRHGHIWNAITFVRSKAKPVDIITVGEELKARDLLENCGGYGYLAECAGATVGANFAAWVDIVWEKFLARKLIQQSVEQATQIMQTNGQLQESFLELVKQRHDEFQGLLNRGTPEPKNLCEPLDFELAYYDAWFKRKEEEYGYALPFEFPLRWRPSEMTLFTGDNGSGKSSMLGLISLICGKQFQKGEKVVVASMEVPPEITLWIMARQLLGRGKMEETAEGRKEIQSALGWLQERVLLYNFLGITDWRELLNTFRFAREHKQGEIFIVDSVMRIGIPDDDYAMQGIAAAAFADFSVKTGAHTFLVVHENKGDGRTKDKVRGSKQWTDNAHNVVGMKRNEDKAAKMEELKAQLRAGDIDEAGFNTKRDGMRKTWDSKFILSKQRWPGSQQNASRWLYFDHESLQFHEQPNVGAFDYRL